MEGLWWSQSYATQIPLRRACYKEHSWLTISSYCSFGPSTALALRSLCDCLHLPPPPNPIVLPQGSWTTAHDEGTCESPSLSEAGQLYIYSLLKNFPWARRSHGCPAVGGSSYPMNPPSFSFPFHKCQVCIALHKFTTPKPAPSPLYPSQPCLPINHLPLNKCYLSLCLQEESSCAKMWSPS